jgi:hypothetical protein
VANTISTIRPALPIIVVTGEEIHERCDAIHSYLIKGDGPEVLLQKLNALVKSKSMMKTMHAVAS